MSAISLALPYLGVAPDLGDERAEEARKWCKLQKNQQGGQENVFKRAVIDRCEGSVDLKWDIVSVNCRDL